MKKFDISCGIPAKEISIIKFHVKRHLMLELPELTDPVETILFFQGRDAWIYNWSVLNDTLPIDSRTKVVLGVIAKLKKDFHGYLKTTQYRFICEITRREDLYNPVVAVKLEA